MSADSNQTYQETGRIVYENRVPTGLLEPMPETTNAAIGNGNKIRQINIEEVSRGYMVRVGCQTYAIETKAQLISKLSEYINEPEKTEQKWFKNELF